MKKWTPSLSALMLLAASACTPVHAQVAIASCFTLESILSKAEQHRARGLKVAVLSGAKEAQAFIEVATKIIGTPPPRDLSKADTIIASQTAKGVVVGFGEGINVCSPALMLSHSTFAKIMLTLKGV